MGTVTDGRVFVDRRDAGLEVAKMLEGKYKDKNALVLGIPRGGIVIACEIADVLNAELSVIITKKLPHPSQEEFAIGAVAEDGSMYLTSSAAKIDRGDLRDVIDRQSAEIKRRIERFRRGQPLPDMKGRVVIIADDGIATGSTIVPALKLCKLKNPARLIVAAPVSGERYVSEINDLADEVVIAEHPSEFYAVGQVYEEFHQVSDEEVIELLDDFERKRKGKRVKESHDDHSR